MESCGPNSTWEPTPLASRSKRLARPQIAEWLQGKEPKKIVYVEKKLMNFVV